ncbi:hypothetical protein Tco_0760380 [Tanacetum coccineum]
MNAITDIRCVLTQKALDAFCDKFHIPEEVHPVLPNQNDTMHERPTGKIGLYTRFFDYANFRLPLSTFLVDVLRHFRINISQLSVIGAAKVTRDPDPVAADFNAHDYTTLVAHPSQFRKFPEVSESVPVLEMDIFVFIHTPDPTKVRVVERERNEDEPRFLDTTVGHTVPLLLVAPDRAEIIEAAYTVVEVVDPVQPRRQGKRKSVVMDAGGASHPPKKLREDHETPSGASVGGKSWSAIKRLLAGAVLNAEVGVAAIPTLPFVTASVSSTPEREDGDHTDSVAEPNLRTIGASQRSSVPIMTTVTTVTSTVDLDLVVKERPIKPSPFSADSSSVGGADPNTSVFLDLTRSDFLVGGIRTVIDPVGSFNS